MMTDLQIIAEIISKYKQDNIELIDIGRNSGTRTSNAYQLLFEGIAPDDGTNGEYMGMERKTNRFRIFAHRLAEKMLNTLYFIDLSKTRLSQAKKAEYQCSRMQHQVLVLSLLYGRPPAVNIARKMLNLAEKFGLAEYAMYSASYLRTVASERGEQALFARYCAKYDFWTAQLKANEDAKTSLEKINIHFVRSVAQKPEKAAEAFEYMHQIERQISSHDSFTLQFHKRKLEALAHYINRDYQKSIDAWAGLGKYLDKNKEYASDTRFAEIALHQMGCYLHLRDYKAGKQCAEICMKYFWEGSNNRLIFMQYYYLLAMQNGEYQKGTEIIEDVMQDRHIGQMGDTNREKWTLFKAYSIYASGTKEFMINKFISEFMKLNTDKRGYNVAILILQWCMLLRQKDFDGLFAKSVSIKEYRLRNLKGRHDYRTNLFVSMMQSAERLNYNSAAVANATKAAFKKMKLAEISYQINMEGLEVIPLDRLWESALEDMR